MRFPAAVAVMAQGGSITATRLHYFDFKDSPKFVWEGMGTFTTFDGQAWEGCGGVVSSTGGGQSSGLRADNLKLVLALKSDQIDDELMTAALNSESTIYGRRYFRAIQFFNPDGTAIDYFYYDFIGVMDRIAFKSTSTMREISLNIEGPFVRKNFPRLEYYSDTDQKRRDPTDKLLEYISGLALKNAKWPKY